MDEALDLTSRVGLEGLTIGSLAGQVGMSKSGLYAHFKSKEDLQIQVLNAAAELFRDAVFTQTLKEPKGLPRIRALFDFWLEWYRDTLSGGCPFIAAASEMDDRTGPVREILVHHLKGITQMILRVARIGVREGHLRPDLDPEQFAFDFWAILLAHHHFSRLIRQEEASEQARRSFERLLSQSIP